MFRIYIKRTCEIRASYELCLESQMDWTHFAHLHRKSHAAYRLLYKRDRREIFLYKARRLYPLPWYDHYIVFRDNDASGTKFWSAYHNVKSGHTHYQSGNVECHGETTSLIGEFVFALPSYWRRFPEFFLWIFKRRMRGLMDEDCAWIGERMRVGAAASSPGCAPVVPERYDLYEDLFGNGELPPADIKFENYVYEGFERVANRRP